MAAERLRCPFCGHLESFTTDSRAKSDHTAIRRRRQCKACGQRYSTHERIVFLTPGKPKLASEGDS